MSTLDDTTKPLGEVNLPEQLQQRLEEEGKRFHHSTSVDEDLAQATARHNALLHEKAAAAHAEVEHAKEVARTHPSDPANIIPDHTTGEGESGGRSSALKEGEERVKSTRSAVAAHQAELSEIEARLQRADEVERQLRAALGEV